MTSPEAEMYEMSPVDPRLKMGTTASMRHSLLGAHERLDLVRRSLGERPSLMTQRTRDLARSMSAARLEAASKSYRPGVRARVTPPALEGSITGDKWNKYVLDRLSKDEHVVFHTIVYPPGMSGSELSQYRGRVTKETVHHLPTGLVPSTITNPTDNFEAFVENECRPAKMPAHFVVVGSKPPEVAQEPERPGAAARPRH